MGGILDFIGTHVYCTCIGIDRGESRIPKKKRTPFEMYEHSINNAPAEPRESELECTVSSSRSSFADIWDSSIPVEIRDGSYHTGIFNPISTVLQKCNQQVMVPYFSMLSVIGWRPLCRDSFHCRGFLYLVNIFYTLVIFLLLLFSYVASITACQARLDIEPLIPDTTSLTPTHRPTTSHNITTPHPTTPSNSTNSTMPTTQSIPSSLPPKTMPAPTVKHPTKSTQYPDVITFFTMYTMSPAQPDWKPTECTHIMSGYVVPKFLHFIAFVIGFYHFRIQESEGLHALVEMVFLQSKEQSKIVKRLRSFLLAGLVWLLGMLACYIFFCFSFGLASVTGFRHSVSRQWVAASMMVLGDLVANCVTFVIMLNYCAQCQLLIYFLRDIALRMEEKTAELGHLMKDLWEVKKHLTNLNSVSAHITTLIIFNFCEVAVIGLTILFRNSEGVPTSQVVYRAIIPVMCLITLMCPLIMATLFAIPMKSSYLWGFFTLVVFVVLLLMQIGILAAKNRYF
ncbi:predicted protein [Nematostella vectensis]|uniref:Uncharacterized protein n=1 Tax=Nematostella vectensis TaxID=45351 RepID=A7S5S9_NEMVE|nr:predicted protein [Nematostella vectensis]|eukprot:XP_001633018.1 predicted protein [Nematostella vectensis]